MEDSNSITERIPKYLSSDIMELATALSIFQSILIQPKLEKEVKVKTKNSGEYKFRYADLAGCMKSAAPALKETGLSIAQIVSDNKLITLLLHKSGQWIKSEVFLPQQNTDYQSFGSALTYLKRYTYCAILGIVADSDDDANYAQRNEVCESGNQFATKKSRTATENDSDMLIKQALADVSLIKTRDMFDNVWAKWQSQCPSICINGSRFWSAMAKKNEELNG